MSDSPQRAEGTAAKVDSLALILLSTIDQESEALDQALEYQVDTLERITRLRIARCEATLVRAANLLNLDAVYHIERAYFHASPSLVTILATIWDAIKTIWSVVQWILRVIEVIDTLGLDDILAKYWEGFNEARNKFRQWVGELSEKLGWGVDGFLHLLHACQGVASVIGAFKGERVTWCDADWMVKTGNVLEQTSDWIHQIEENPGAMIDLIFQISGYENFYQAKEVGDDWIKKIQSGLDRGQEALEGLSQTASHLRGLEYSLPYVIRQHIPDQIWNGLEKVEDLIDENLLPKFQKLEKQVDQIANIIATYNNKFSDLANKLNNPGAILMGVDDLPSYVKDKQEEQIDEVTSRKFSEAANDEWLGLEPDLKAFEKVDNAARSPLPSLGFMTIEAEGRLPRPGITVEPHETWFIDGYSDKH